MVSREPNPDDRRSLLVRLTEKGETLQDATPTLDRIFESCCIGLEPDEIQQLSRLLKKLNESLSYQYYTFLRIHNTRIVSHGGDASSR